MESRPLGRAVETMNLSGQPSITGEEFGGMRPLERCDTLALGPLATTEANRSHYDCIWMWQRLRLLRSRS